MTNLLKICNKAILQIILAVEEIFPSRDMSSILRKMVREKVFYKLTLDYLKKEKESQETFDEAGTVISFTPKKQVYNIGDDIEILLPDGLPGGGEDGICHVDIDIKRLFGNVTSLVSETSGVVYSTKYLSDSGRVPKEHEIAEGLIFAQKIAKDSILSKEKSSVVIFVKDKIKETSYCLEVILCQYGDIFIDIMKRNPNKKLTDYDLVVC